MRPFVENLPFLSIFLAIVAGIVCASLRRGITAYRLTLSATMVAAIMNAAVLAYTYLGDLSFTYTMGRFVAPYGNAIKCGPLQGLLSTVFCVVLAMSLVGGRRDLFHDILPEKQRFTSSW